MLNDNVHNCKMNGTEYSDPNLRRLEVRFTDCAAAHDVKHQIDFCLSFDNDRFLCKIIQNNLSLVCLIHVHCTLCKILIANIKIILLL